MRREAVWLAGLLLGAVLAGCALGPQTKEQPASYDLGPVPAHAAGNPQLPLTVLVPAVISPEWLDGTGIVYRLAYQDAARAQVYALSRWTAPPAALLTQRLRARLSGVARGVVSGLDALRADYVLRVELEDFSQIFDAPDRSRIVVRARAGLVDPARRSLLAQRVFSIERRAPSADAPGAVRAFAAASDELTQSVVRWAQERLRGEKTADR